MKTFNLFNYLPSFQVHTTPERKICSSTWNCRTAFTIIGRSILPWFQTKEGQLDAVQSIINLYLLLMELITYEQSISEDLTSSTNNVITIPETNKRNLQLNTDPVSKSVIMSSSLSVSCDAYTLQV